jgi:hypothetical protein
MFLQNTSNPPIATTYTDSLGHYVLPNIPRNAGPYNLAAFPSNGDYVGWVCVYSELPQENPTTWNLQIRKRIIVLEPKEDAVLTTLHPVFCWEPLAEAVRYSLQINRTDPEFGLV